MTYTVLLYYRYAAIPNVEAERDAQRELCQRLGLKGRILIGAEGINGTVAGSAEATQAYRAAMAVHPLWRDIEYKVDTTDTMPFPRLRVKARAEVVTLGVDVDLTQAAEHISAE